jgi:hypothetical protein
MKQAIVAILLFVLTGCGITNSLSRYPAEDREVYDLLKLAGKKTAAPGIHQQISTQYDNAVNRHLQNIQQYQSGGNWENTIKEYEQLNRLADAVSDQGITARRYDAEYTAAKQSAARQYYEQASSLLNTQNRQDAQEAYALLQRVQRLQPGFGNVNTLLDKAQQQSILNVVINPVDYYSRSYNSWGFNNDFMQQDIVRDLKYQLSSTNVRVYSDWEARANNIYPDRVIDLKWDEMFIPTPIDQTFTRQVSKEIQVGLTEDKKPIYNTVYATVYVTRRSLQTHGSLSCRIIDPANNQVVLWDNFPARNDINEEYATYRGDSRALSSYDWALINNRSSFRNMNQGDMLTNVYRQVYPQLVNRIRSVTW